VNYLPTLIAGRSTPTPPPGPTPGGGAYGHAQQHPQPPAYGYPYHGYGAGQTPPYGPPPFGPVFEPRRDRRSTALLVVVALVVALAAGGTVYALMSGGGDGDQRAGGDPSAPATASGGASSGTEPDASGPGQSPDTRPPSSSAPADNGTVPEKFLGTWSTSFTNAAGRHNRRLTVEQGEIGDTMLSLVADGPTGSGSYHCVFKARLTAASSGRLDIGPSSVTVGRPPGACSPGSASDITLLPDGSLRRVSTGDGRELTYTRD